MKIKTLLLGIAASVVMIPSSFAARGTDGEVKLIYWQAPSTLNPYLSGGIKDIHASSLIIEPLARYDETGAMVPWLVDSVPTIENVGFAKDLNSITWKLSSCLKWSDGSPVTSADVKFTWEYCTHPESGCAQTDKFNDISSIDTPDDRTIVINFGSPKPSPYSAFVGAETPILQKAQFENCIGAAAPTCTEANFGPIGTGAFLLTDFRTNDVAVMEANPMYRDANKPAFARLTLKGGGDATAAGRAVFETGEFDYAWNLQLAPDVLQNMQAAGKGTLISAFGTLVERIMVNMTNPNPALGEERATNKHAHPFLSDINVRKALSMAIDRELLVEIGYGDAGRPSCNVLPAPAIYKSTANDACLVQDIPGANKLLDQAGWKRGSDGVRMKDGVRLSMLYQTSTNAVRQDFQALIKQWWSEIGVETELRNIDASVFFGGDAGSPDTYQKFYADVEMYANNFNGTDPESYMANWRCEDIPSPDTQWQGNNIPRYCNADYDKLVAELSVEGDINERARIAKAMNDMLMQNYVMIPLVDRGNVSARTNSLGGVVLNTWDSQLWNVADWYRK